MTDMREAVERMNAWQIEARVKINDYDQGTYCSESVDGELLDCVREMRTVINILCDAMQPEIDRRVAEERARLLGRLQDLPPRRTSMNEELKAAVHRAYHEAYCGYILSNGRHTTPEAHAAGLQAAIAAHSAFIREAINAEIDTWEQVPLRGAMKRKIAKVLDQIERTQNDA